MSTRTWIGKVFIACSLDGFIARPDGDIDWLLNAPVNDGHVQRDPEPPAELLYPGHIASVDAMVMGRGTYEKVVAFPEWPYTHHVLVLSSTLPVDTDPERIAVVRTVDDLLAELARRGATGVYIDGGRVIQEFLRRDLVDDIVLTHVPVLLGSGLSLFGDLDHDVRLTHRGTIAIEDGMITSRYTVVR